LIIYAYLWCIMHNWCIVIRCQVIGGLFIKLSDVITKVVPKYPDSAVSVRTLLFVPQSQSVTYFVDGCTELYIFFVYIYIYIYIYIYCVCVLAVYNKAQAQRISNREFNLWTFLQGNESIVATFLAETCVMSHQSIWVLLMKLTVGTWFVW